MTVAYCSGSDTNARIMPSVIFLWSSKYCHTISFLHKRSFHLRKLAMYLHRKGPTNKFAIYLRDVLVSRGCSTL